MSGKQHIEARLDRSLQNQIRLPALGKDFDAAVWARIEAAESRATNPVAEPRAMLRMSRWLAVSNIVGVAVTLAVALYFALGSFAGVEAPKIDLGVSLPMPAISAGTVTGALVVLGQLLGIAALLFGLSFTSLGRRLRHSFS